MKQLSWVILVSEGEIDYSKPILSQVELNYGNSVLITDAHTGIPKDQVLADFKLGLDLISE